MALGRMLKIVIVSAIVGYFIESLFVRDLLLSYRNVELDLKEKNVIVTGASTGIGEQTAYHYARHGARLVITARRQKTLEEVAAKCRKLGSPDVSIIAADMSVPEQVDRVSQHTLKHFGGRIDHVILNHIGAIAYTFYNFNPDFARKLTQINYLSYVQLATAFLPHLEASHGSLVVVQSVVGRMRAPFTATYAATKHALEGFFGSLRREMLMLRSNVTISILPFGLIGTDTAKNAIEGKVTGISFNNPSDAGLQVVRVAVTRPRDHFWPWWGRLVPLLNVLTPDLLEWMESKQYDVEKFRDEIDATNAAWRQRREAFMKTLDASKTKKKAAKK